MDNKKIIYSENKTLFEMEPEPIQPRSLGSKILRRFVAGIFILSMLYIFGGYQYFQFQKTPDDVATGEYTQQINADKQSIPVTVYVLTEASEDRNTDRPKRLISNTNQILHQIAVELSPITVSEITLSDVSLSGPELVADPDRLQSILPSISSREVYVVITPSLGGLNGIAFSSKDTVAVAEYTTSYDFRVLAHEIGHLLDLSHVSDKSNLMFSGSGGTDVTQTQAEKAHQEAVNFLSES